MADVGGGGGGFSHAKGGKYTKNMRKRQPASTGLMQNCPIASALNPMRQLFSKRDLRLFWIILLSLGKLT